MTWSLKTRVPKISETFDIRSPHVDVSRAMSDASRHECRRPQRDRTLCCIAFCTLYQQRKKELPNAQAIQMQTLSLSLLHYRLGLQCLQ